MHDIERLLGKCVMDAKARQKDMVHIMLLKAELEQSGSLEKCLMQQVPCGSSILAVNSQRS